MKKNAADLENTSLSKQRRKVLVENTALAEESEKNARNGRN